MIDYDLIIIGSGPAGMSACLYATRSNLKTLVIERNYPGGKVVKANLVENWPGTESINGVDLSLQMFKHAFSYGGVYEQNNVLDVKDFGNYKEVVLQDKTYKCYAVIICIGTSERKMGIPGEDKFYGNGVSYCALCDASLYKGKVMAVIGSSEYALEETIYLSKFASKIYLINSGNKYNANEDTIKKIEDEVVIETINNTEVIAIEGKEFVENIIIKSKDNKERKIETSVVFPFLGSKPDTMLASRLKITNKKNYIEVNERQETKVPGIYAAGDCTTNPLKQIITACSDGAIAAIESYKYITKIKKES